MFFGTQLAIFLTYVPLNFLYELVVPPKETKALDANLTPEEAEAAQAAEKAAKEKADAIENMGQPAIDLENSDMNSNASEKKSKAPPLNPEPSHE